MVSEDQLAGAVGVIRDGDVLARVSAGFSDIDDRAGFLPHTRVRVGSVTKMLVAATILQMVAEGVVVLDFPVEAYLPGRLRGVGIDGNAITVRQLLNHTSGLPEYFDNLADLDFGLADDDQLLDAALRKPGQFPPGTARKYTNTNYIVAGLIIAAVAHRPAAEEVTRRIIVPLGLKDSYFPSPGESGLQRPFAHGYELINGRRVDVTENTGSAMGMDGALVSTAEHHDLHHRIAGRSGHA
jgi:D-alanyl-D-alanine carboxypeptidase